MKKDQQQDFLNAEIKSEVLYDTLNEKVIFNIQTEECAYDHLVKMKKVVPASNWIKIGHLQYEGGVKDGNREGKGKLYSHEEGNLHVDGSFQKNVPDGKKIRIYYTWGGFLYVGPMVGGNYEGSGRQYEETGK